MLLAMNSFSAFTHTEKVKRSLQKKSDRYDALIFVCCAGRRRRRCFWCFEERCRLIILSISSLKKICNNKRLTKKKTPKIAASVAFVLQVV